MLPQASSLAPQAFYVQTPVNSHGNGRIHHKNITFAL